MAELQKTHPNGVEALKGVSFTVAEGEIFGLHWPQSPEGPSGFSG
jgi:hypothetical protein